MLLALGVLDAAGYSVIVPVAPAIADVTGAGPATIGLLVASFPAGMVAGFALAGWAVRRRGSRALLIGSLALVALGALGFVLGDTLGVYFVARTLMGLGSGGIWIGVTFDTLERWPGQEYLCMSRVYAAYAAGGLIGPALGAFGGIHGPFLAYLVLLSLAVPLVLLVGEPPTRRAFAGDRAAFRSRPFWIASGAILFAVLTLGVLEGVLPLHFAERLTERNRRALRRAPPSSSPRAPLHREVAVPRPLVFAAVLFSVAGISLAGMVATTFRCGYSRCCSPRSGSGSPTPAP